MKTWQVSPVVAVHSTIGELSAEGAAPVQSCTNSLDQAGPNQKLVTRTAVNSVGPSVEPGFNSLVLLLMFFV